MHNIPIFGIQFTISDQLFLDVSLMETRSKIIVYATMKKKRKEQRQQERRQQEQRQQEQRQQEQQPQKKSEKPKNKTNWKKTFNILQQQRGGGGEIQRTAEQKKEENKQTKLNKGKSQRQSANIITKISNTRESKYGFEPDALFFFFFLFSVCLFLFSEPFSPWTLTHVLAAEDHTQNLLLRDGSARFSISCKHSRACTCRL